MTLKENLFERLQGVDQVLVDPSITTVRLITNPEKVVLKETQRAFRYFYLHKMNIDAVIIRWPRLILSRPNLTVSI